MCSPLHCWEGEWNDCPSLMRCMLILPKSGFRSMSNTEKLLLSGYRASVFYSSCLFSRLCGFIPILWNLEKHFLCFLSDCRYLQWLGTYFDGIAVFISSMVFFNKKTSITIHVQAGQQGSLRFVRMFQLTGTRCREMRIPCGGMVGKNGTHDVI